MKRIAVLGQRFGKLTVVEEYSKKAKVECDCGTIKIVLRSNLIAGYTLSCGCLQRERTSKANKTHGHAAARTGAYRSWKAMKTRCDNPMRDSSHRYHDRGISYDTSWSKFENFYNDMGDRPEGTELDRIDNSLGYSKENCRWVTHQVNCNNKG